MTEETVRVPKRTTAIKIDHDLYKRIRIYIHREGIKGIEIKMKDFLEDACLARLESSWK